MLDRVEADAVEVQFLGHPHTPVQQVVNDFRMIQVQIVSQQVVVVAVFGVYPFAPLLALAEYAEYLVDMLVVGALTGAREVIPVVLEVGVLVAASLEIVTGVRLDLVRLAHRLVPVRRIDLLSHELFGIVPSAFMVHHGVEVDLHSVLVQLVDGLDEFLLRSVFGPDRIFLVELSQIVQIVCRVALVLLLVRFVCGRYPYGRYACLAQMLGVLLQLVPKVAVVGQIPFEILHHDSVSHNSIFLFFGYSALWRSARVSFVARGMESFNFHAKRISPLSRSGRVLIIRPLSGRRIVRKRQCVRSVSASGADVSVKEAGSGSVRRHGCGMQA